MTQVAFGLFDWIDRSTGPLHQLYKDRLQLLEVARFGVAACTALAFKRISLRARVHERQIARREIVIHQIRYSPE
jgi:hypothetical protein